MWRREPNLGGPGVCAKRETFPGPRPRMELRQMALINHRREKRRWPVNYSLGLGGKFWTPGTREGFGFGFPTQMKPRLLTHLIQNFEPKLKTRKFLPVARPPLPSSTLSQVSLLRRSIFGSELFCCLWAFVSKVSGVWYLLFFIFALNFMFEAIPEFSSVTLC